MLSVNLIRWLLNSWLCPTLLMDSIPTSVSNWGLGIMLLTNLSYRSPRKILKLSILLMEYSRPMDLIKWLKTRHFSLSTKSFLCKINLPSNWVMQWTPVLLAKSLHKCMFKAICHPEANLTFQKLILSTFMQLPHLPIDLLVKNRH